MDTKKQVLQHLESNKGSFVSGDRLAGNLGLSRTAVWKAINGLRKEGHKIKAHSGKGYILDDTSDLLTAEGILPYLSRPVPVLVYDSVESTNKTASGLAMDGCAEWTTVIAGEQTMGKGRLGRTFYSPPHTGLYLSMVIQPRFDVTKAVLITTAASVAVAKAIEKVCGVTPMIKWVNDLYLNGKKVCGILTEALTDFESGRISHVILGIGINCFTTDFPQEAGDHPGSIMGDFSKNQLAGTVIQNVRTILADPEDRRFMDYYRDHSMVIGKDILVHKAGRDAPLPGKATKIDRDGGLKVLYEDGTTETLRTGEITIRLKDVL